MCGRRKSESVKKEKTMPENKSSGMVFSFYARFLRLLNRNMATDAAMMMP